MFILAILLTVILIGTAKLLMKGEDGVGFWHVFAPVFVLLILFNIVVNVIDANDWGFEMYFAALFATGLILFFTSNTMYEWGRKKSLIFAGVFVVSYLVIITAAPILLSTLLTS